MSSVEICEEVLVSIDIGINQGSTQNLKAIGATETKNYACYLRDSLLLLLFNVACIAFLVFCYELAWQKVEESLNQIIKVIASMGAILIIVIVAKAGDASVGYPNFYYI